MIDCILGSLLGTLLGVGGAAYYAYYLNKKDHEKQISELKKLIDDLTTFKIKFGDEIFRKG